MTGANVKQLFDTIDAVFGRSSKRTSDYSLHEGDVVTVDGISYTVRAGDFVDPERATALELACCLQGEGADVRVVPASEVGFSRVDPLPSIQRGVQ